MLIPGAVRASIGLATTVADIDALLDALVRFLPERRPDLSAGAAVAGIAGLLVLAVLALAGGTEASLAARAADPAMVTVHSVPKPKGLMVTSGGWAYCEQVRALARRTGYTLLCGR